MKRSTLILSPGITAILTFIRIYLAYSNKFIVYHYNSYKYTVKDSQKTKKKSPRVTNEGWNSQKQLSGLIEKTPVSSSKALTIGLVPIPYFILKYM